MSDVSLAAHLATVDRVLDLVAPTDDVEATRADRIRWLKVRLDRANSERDELLKEIERLRGQLRFAQNFARAEAESIKTSVERLLGYVDGAVL